MLAYQLMMVAQLWVARPCFLLLLLALQLRVLLRGPLLQCWRPCRGHCGLAAAAQRLSAMAQPMRW